MDSAAHGIFILGSGRLGELSKCAFEAASATHDRTTSMPTSTGKRTAKLPTTLAKRVIDALQPTDKPWIALDDKLKGFGVRIHPTGGKVYVAQARGPNGQKRVTVGRHPLIGAEQARQRAALIITRIKAGEDPVPLPLAAKFAGGPTVTDLARRYLEEHVAVRCKPKTARTARSVVNRHIVPALGRLPLAAVERQHVMELHESLCETPAMANMTVKTLTHMCMPLPGTGA